MYDDDDFDSNMLADGTQFAEPGGRSALRAGRRNKPCPTCKRKNRLTQADVDRHYQCDQCADRAEGRMGGEY